MSVHVDLMQAADPSIVTDPPLCFVTDQLQVLQDTDLTETLENAAEQLDSRIVSYEGNGSGWIVDRLISLDMTVWKVEPLRGGSYIPSPDWIRNTGCVVNVQNGDDPYCFRHAVMAALYRPDNHNRVTSYTRYYTEPDAPDFQGIEYPVKISDIRKFETRNPGISVNIYGVNGCMDSSENHSNTDQSLATTDDDTDDYDDDDGEVSMEVDEEHDDNDDNDDENVRGESTMSDSDASDDDDSDDEETEEDRQFINNEWDSDDADEDESFYRRIDSRPIGQPSQDRSMDIDPTTIQQQQQPTTPTRSASGRRSTGGKRGGYFYPLRIAPVIHPHRHVNLLILEDPGDVGKYHYVTIKNFGGLMRGQYTRTVGHTLHFCYR